MRSVFTIAALALALALALPACGKKGNPLPPSAEGPARVSRLDAGQSEGGVLLNWQMPGKGVDWKKVRIFRRELASNRCPGCLEASPVIADISSSEASVAGDVFHYRDSTAVPGRLYGYRVAICDGRGICGAASEEVLIMFGGERTKP